MTIAHPDDVQVRMVSAAEARREIERLLDKVGVKRDELEARGEAWELDAVGRGVLADIQALEFLLERAEHRQAPVTPC